MTPAVNKFLHEASWQTYHRVIRLLLLFNSILIPYTKTQESATADLYLCSFCQVLRQPNLSAFIIMHYQAKAVAHIQFAFLHDSIQTMC